MRHTWTTILALASTLTLGCDSDGEGTGDISSGGERGAHWEIDGLEPLEGGYVYEGWLIIDAAPVSTGRFNATLGETSIGTSSGIPGAEGATSFVLTIEPGEGDDPAPSASKLLAGDFDAEGGTLSVAHSAALGDDFTAAAGQFLVETPTSEAAEDYANGIWYLDASAGSASLELPALPEGWQYEGWVVGDEGPVSTGRFDAGAGADDDGAGPTAGPLGFPAFPGQDFIEPPVSLVGASAVISIEPDPDDSAAPFLLKPLVAASIEDVPDKGLQSMDNNAAGTNPTGSFRLE